MARLRLVNPEVSRIDLGDGEWIEVRRELTAGEQRRAMTRMISSVDMAGRMTPNMEQLGKTEVIAYLLDWSLRDANDKPVAVSEAAVDALSPESFKVIADAVESHIQSVESDAKKAATASA